MCVYKDIYICVCVYICVCRLRVNPRIDPYTKRLFPPVFSHPHLQYSQASPPVFSHSPSGMHRPSLRYSLTPLRYSQASPPVFSHHPPRVCTGRLRKNRYR